MQSLPSHTWSQPLRHDGATPIGKHAVEAHSQHLPAGHVPGSPHLTIGAGAVGKESSSSSGARVFLMLTRF
jgi:hypothetical protein